MTILNAAALSVNAKAADRLAWLHDSEDNVLDDYRPGWQDDSYSPTPEDEYELLGFRLVMEKQCADPPKGLPFSCIVAFFEGVHSAWLARIEKELAEDREAILLRHEREDELEAMADRDEILARWAWTDAVGRE